MPLFQQFYIVQPNDGKISSVKDLSGYSFHINYDGNF